MAAPPPRQRAISSLAHRGPATRNGFARRTARLGSANRRATQTETRCSVGISVELLGWVALVSASSSSPLPKAHRRLSVARIPVRSHRPSQCVCRVPPFGCILAHTARSSDRPRTAAKGPNAAICPRLFCAFKSDTEQSTVVSQKRTCIHAAELQVCTTSRPYLGSCGSTRLDPIVVVGVRRTEWLDRVWGADNADCLL